MIPEPYDGEISIPFQDVVQTMRMRVVLQGAGFGMLRLRLSLYILRFAAWVGGYGITMFREDQ